MQPYRIRAFSVLAVLCAVPALVRAQTPLGAGDEPLSVTASTYAGYDTDITAIGANPAITPAGVDKGAFNTGVSLSMSYAGGSPKINFFTFGTSEYRYYRASESASVTTPLASGVAGFTAPVGRRLGIHGSLQGTYYPRFQLSVLPPTTEMPMNEPPPTVDYGISGFDVVSYSGTVGLSYQLDSRSSVRLDYSRSQFKYLGQQYELSSHSIGGGYSRNLTRYATLQLGYREQGGEYITGLNQRQATVRQRVIDAGIRYSRPVSLSRRTTVGFATGSTALDNGNATFYTLTGSANLNHQLSRTWMLGAAYARRVGLVGGFIEPVFSDSITAHIGGLLGNRVSLNTSVGYANGQVGFSSVNNNYDTLRANSTISVPITRRLSGFGTYFYYRHMFDQSISLPIGIAPYVNRNGARAGLTLKVY